jgi:hypothetical protein
MDKTAGAVASRKARENAFEQGEATFKDRPLTEAEPQTSEIFLSECGGLLGHGKGKNLWNLQADRRVRKDPPPR